VLQKLENVDDFRDKKIELVFSKKIFFLDEFLRKNGEFFLEKNFFAKLNSVEITELLELGVFFLLNVVQVHELQFSAIDDFAVAHEKAGGAVEKNFDDVELLDVAYFCFEVLLEDVDCF
jgi:hypothetical protein